MTVLASLCVATTALATKLASAPALACERHRGAHYLGASSAPVTCPAKERGSGVTHGRSRLAALSTTLLVHVWALCLSLGRLVGSRTSLHAEIHWNCLLIFLVHYSLDLHTLCSTILF